MKSDFNCSDQARKTKDGKDVDNIWTANKTKNNTSNLINRTFKFSAGFTKDLGKRSKLAAVSALNYNITPKRTEFENRIFSISNNIASTNFDYSNTKYAQDVLWGGLANVTLPLGNNDKISLKTIFNVDVARFNQVIREKQLPVIGIPEPNK